MGLAVGCEEIGVFRCDLNCTKSESADATARDSGCYDGTVAPFDSLLSLLVLQRQYSSFSSVKVRAAVHTIFSVT